MPGYVAILIFHACVVVSLLAPRWVLDAITLIIVLPTFWLIACLAIDPAGMTDRFPELLQEIAAWLPSR